MDFIYRVQNEKKLGPYKGSCEKWETKSHIDCYRTPTPCNDITETGHSLHFWRDEDEDFLFGFESLKQLSSWFSQKEMKNLFKLGFSIVKIKPKTLIKGKRQVIFKPYKRWKILEKIETFKEYKQCIS